MKLALKQDTKGIFDLVGVETPSDNLPALISFMSKKSEGVRSTESDNLLMAIVINNFAETRLRLLSRAYGSFTTLSPVEWITGGSVTLGLIHLVSAII